jgi:hypothetical protein
LIVSEHFNNQFPQRPLAGEAGHKWALGMMSFAWVY